MVNGNFEVFGRNKKVYLEDVLHDIKFLNDDEFYEKKILRRQEKSTKKAKSKIMLRMQIRKL